MESDAKDRFVVVRDPEGKPRRMLLPRQHDGGWPYSQEMLDRIARNEGSVLITGESGTGKELLAYYLHGKSQRSNGPLVAVNCSGLTEERMQGELFGWKKGAFTGTTGDHKGRVVEAEGGTLFLDEIGNMDGSNQGRLLRFMQTGEIEPLGAPKQRANVRVIAATNKVVGIDPKNSDLIPDLYYRFRFVNLRLPALRDRQSDIFRLLLEPEYLGMEDPFTGITLEAMLLLAVQEWPGNMRELKRVCEDIRLFPDIKHRRASIRHPDLLPRLSNGIDETIASASCPLPTLDLEYVKEWNATTKALARGAPLPDHVLHDLLLPGGEESLCDPLDVLLAVCKKQAGPADQTDSQTNALQNISSLVWAMHSSESPLPYTFNHVPEEHILPLDALGKEFRDGVGINGVFNCSDFIRWMTQPGDRWIPQHWEISNCGLADAIANLGCFCRRFIINVPKTQSEQETSEESEADKYGLLKPRTRKALKLLPPLLRKWGMPKPPRQERLNEEQARRIKSLHFRESLETVIQALQLYREGVPPKQIESRLNGIVTATRVRSIARRCGSDFKPLKKNRGGRPPSKTTCA
ncbi:MAG: sigma 54-interacting transcriptional regulator [Verrucomicrobiia bacterium]